MPKKRGVGRPKKEPLKELIVRDMKTGRYAPAWKAERWPDRFHFRRRAALEAGIREVDAEAGVIQKFRKREAALTKNAKLARGLFFDWAKDGNLLNWYYLKKITAAKDRFRKNLWVVEVGYGGKKAGKNTPDLLAFRVDVEKGTVAKDR